MDGWVCRMVMFGVKGGDVVRWGWVEVNGVFDVNVLVGKINFVFIFIVKWIFVDDFNFLLMLLVRLWEYGYVWRLWYWGGLWWYCVKLKIKDFGLWLYWEFNLFCKNGYLSVVIWWCVGEIYVVLCFFYE